MHHLSSEAIKVTHLTTIGIDESTLVILILLRLF